MNTQRILLLGLTCLARNTIQAGASSFLDSKGFLADSAALCQVAYNEAGQSHEKKHTQNRIVLTRNI